MPVLSFVDQAFFLLETAARPMNVGVLTVIAPSARARRGFADRLVARLRERPVGPPFDHRLRPQAILPELVADPHIDVGRQIRRHRLRRGATLVELYELVCKLHVQVLPRDEPLWQAHVIEGLADGKVAFYFKTHHGIIDGIGFVEAFKASVSNSARTRQLRAIWEGVPGAAAPAERDDAVSDLLRATLRDSLARARTASDFGRLLIHEALRGAGLGRGLAVPFAGTPDAFKTAPSPARVLGHSVLQLSRMRALGKARGATINDVLLTVLDLAMRHYLEAHGAAPEAALVADVPVALSKSAGAGNRITILQLPLGRGGLTPAQRLEAVQRETGQLKAELRAISGDALVLYSILVHTAASAIEALGLRRLPMLANAVISNPYGIDQWPYYMGARMELALPVSVIAHHQTVNITATSCADEMHVTCMAIREALPDVQRLADAAVAALDELERSLSRRPAARARRG